MSELASFEECYDESVSRASCQNVILGNGYSIGAASKFSYGRLYDVASSKLNDRIRALFGKYGTVNFEQVLKLLREGSFLAETYDLHDRTLIAEDYSELKNALVETISEVHPKSQDEILPNKTDSKALIDSSAEFLNKFKRVFTLNYDHLVYWTILKLDPRHKDGFSNFGDEKLPLLFKKEDIGDQKSIYYLHGALHLFQEPRGLCKLKSSPGDSLLSQVNRAILNDEYPVVIAEGTSAEKWKWIQRNHYLTFCWNQLQNIEGDLFIYGCSLGESDNHLIEAISANKRLGTIYISIYGDENSFENGKIMNSAKLLDTGSKSASFNCTFFESDSANVWSSKK